jgi:hypothetical protein
LEVKKKKEKLEKIGKEVEDFHPVLNELFHNMTEIVHVEYTHGLNELGADFVLARNDSILKQTDYIGVIVKIGTIKQDNEGVRRQIRECSYERIFGHTNTKGYLNTIWIITNMTITENAKRGFQNDFSNSKIKFIEQETLISLINDHYPTFWEDIPTGISSYFNTESAKCKLDDEKLSILENSEFYVEPDIVKSNYEDLKHNQVQKKIDILKEISSSELIIIEGGMGAGKSKLLRKLFLYYCDANVFNVKKVFPVRLVFSAFMNDYGGNSKVILDEIFNDYQNIKVENINYFVILIDAIDEINSDYCKQMEYFEKAFTSCTASYRGKPVKFVFTIREICYLEKYQFLKSIKKYYIKPLSGPKLFDFLCNICAELTRDDRLVEDIKKSDLFKGLPNYPISAILLARLISEGHRKDLPMNITELYSKYAELSLGRWDIDKGLRGDEEYKIARRFMLTIAELFFENNLYYISETEAKRIYNEYINIRNFPNIDKDAFFDDLIFRSGMFARNEYEGLLFFKHRTFIEFFYAQNLQECRKSILDYEIFSPPFHNIALFYIGIQSDCEHLISEIVKYEPRTDLERFYKSYAMADYFLAGYATPYNVVKDNLYQIMIDVAQFYNDIVNKNIVMPLSTWPKAPLLWFFQFLIRDRYAYSYFINALDDTCCKIEADGNIDDETKVIALFLVCCIKLELKIEDPFDYLLAFHQKDLPLAVKFIITDEAKNMQKQSLILKKLSRKVKNDLQKSNIVYKNIFEQPILPQQKVTEALKTK